MSIDSYDKVIVCCDCGHPFEETNLTNAFCREYGEHKCDGCIREYDKDFVKEFTEKGGNI